MSHPYADPYRQTPQVYSAQEENNYPSPHANGFQSNPSTEKMIDPELSTERINKGRRNLPPTSSWAGPPPRSTGILRMWRKGERGKQWSRGGGWRTFFRLCCCCTTMTLILLISIVLTILLYVRPPNIKLNDIDLGSGGVSLTSSGFSISISLGISVANPNWFGIDFTQISANVRYPGTTGSFGSGTLNNVDFAGYTESTFDFPLALNYSTALDPNKTILNDLIDKCGVSGNAQQDITVDYDLYLKLKIAGITISPTVSSDASFACPVTASDIEQIAGESL